MEVRDGELISVVKSPQYNLFLDEIARRTYETNGDYYVNPPSLVIRETLNDFQGNDGIFSENTLTYNNNIASEDLATYQISPLKAYINGYEAYTISPVFLDFDKPRTTQTLTNQDLIYSTGSTFTLNRVSGSPRLGLSTSYTVSLRDSRVDSDSSTTSPGNEIGISRVYDFSLESGSYSTSNSNLNEWDISLYDTQLYTEITLNENLDSNVLYNIPCQIKGKSSGAKGYLRYDGRNTGIITAYNTNGSFIIGEKLIFNGIENNRVSIAVTQHTIDEVKSLFGRVGSALTFSADTKQYQSLSVGLVNISARVGGVSTVTSTDYIFTGNVKIGSLVSYTNPGISTVTYSKVSSVSQNSLTIVGITTVNGICDGALPSSAINPSDFRILTSSLQRSTSNTLYTDLPKKNISEVNLDLSSLIIRKEFDVTITSNSTGPIQSGSSDETFLSFDEERYVLTTSTGRNEELSADKFSFSSGGTILTINGLSTTNASGCKLIATLRKSKVKSKVKNKNRVATLVIDKSKYAESGIGATTLNDGLSYGNYPYGTRVQDEDICLLKPEVTSVLAVFESKTTSDPVLPNITINSLNGVTNSTTDLILGEEFVGEKSSSIGVCVSRVNTSKIEYVYKNSNSLIVGEKITFKESGVTGTISNIGISDDDITKNFALQKGQTNTILDYCRLVRNPGFLAPSKKLKVVYEFASFSNSDSGDITSINSYNQFDYCDLDTINESRVSDIIDTRPRVSDYTVSQDTRSPFEFLGRSFTDQQNSSKNILASDESFALDYSFYLPRIDKVFLSQDGVFQLSKGQPAEFPQPPLPIDNSLELATVYLPAYLCNVSDASIRLTEHRRYTMSDIRKLETRIENLEYYNSLSFLESGSKSLQIKDSNGLDRKKLGLFVDDFSGNTKQKKKNTLVRNAFDSKKSELRPRHYTTSIDLLLGYSSIISSGSGLDPTADLQYVSTFDGTGIKKTGRMLTLDYTEVVEIDQPYSTRVVSVAPFRGAFYGGSIELFPSSDIWIDQVKKDDNLISIVGQSSQTEIVLSPQEFDSQVGYNPVQWGSWESQWTGEGTEIQYRTASRQVVKEVSSEKKSVGNTVVSTAVIPYMRSRNIEFSAKKLKPFTRVYPFFDGIDMSSYTFPKLLEITMVSGAFQTGETVVGTLPDVVSTATNLPPSITFRAAQQNHKYGPYNAPTDVYILNPYAREQFLSSSYSSTSSILNVDTYSLSDKTQGQYSGVIKSGMILRGQTSGAQAIVSDVRLITDNYGVLIGNIYIPNPNVLSNPKFRVGTKLFRLTNSETNSQTEGIATTAAEKEFFSEGTLNTVQENILVIKNLVYETQTKIETRTESSGPITSVPSTPRGNDSPAPSSPPPSTPQVFTVSKTYDSGIGRIYPPTPPQVVPVVTINRGDAAYGQPAQSRLIAAYNAIPNLGDVKNISQLAKALGVDIKRTDSGGLTQSTGDKMYRRIDNKAESRGYDLNTAIGPGSGGRSGSALPISSITARPNVLNAPAARALAPAVAARASGTLVANASPSNRSSSSSSSSRGSSSSSSSSSRGSSSSSSSSSRGSSGGSSSSRGSSGGSSRGSSGRR